MITAKQLKSILNRATNADIEKYLPWFNTFFVQYEITTPERKAAFIAQIGHESSHLKDVEENLNYSASGLRQTFGKYFPTDEVANRYARKPEQIANIIYAGRIGNGGVESGDGWRFRGRGLVQLTGRQNYANMSKLIGVDLLTHPERLTAPEYAVQSSCCWWQSKGLNDLSDTITDEAFKQITRTINGGINGLSERLEIWGRAKKVLILNVEP